MIPLLVPDKTIQWYPSSVWVLVPKCSTTMGCTPSMLLDHKSRRRDSTGSQEAALAKVAPTPVCNKAVQAAKAPRASLESDGFSIQLSSKKDSYVSQMGNNFATQLHIKRISGKLISVTFLVVIFTRRVFKSRYIYSSFEDWWDW